MANNNEISANEADIDRILVEAVRWNDVAAVQQAIRTGADVNAVHRVPIRVYVRPLHDTNRTRPLQDATPLFVACDYRAKDEIVRILLDAGADPRWDPCPYSTTSPIAQACSLGRVSIVKILINHDNSLLEHSDSDGDTPLFAAISGEKVDVVRFLIHRGANVSASTANGMTPLLSACHNENVEIVQRLLAAGADMEARDPSSRTALHHAVLHDNIEIMRELILRHNANMFAVNSDEETPFDIACSELFSDAIDPLLEIYGSKMTEDHDQLALHAILRAAEYSFAQLRGFHPPLTVNPLRIILPLGKLTLNHFRTLLHSLNTNLIRNGDDSGKLPIHIACETNAPVGVLSLLSDLDAATLHTADHNGALPMHECCRGIVDNSSVRYLVEQGGVGTLAALNQEGAVPLHVLCGSTNPSLRTVQDMVQSFPGSVAAMTHSGQYPFVVAACNSSASLSVVYELVSANPHLLVLQ